MPLSPRPHSPHIPYRPSILSTTLLDLRCSQSPVHTVEATHRVLILNLNARVLRHVYGGPPCNRSRCSARRHACKSYYVLRRALGEHRQEDGKFPLTPTGTFMSTQIHLSAAPPLNCPVGVSQLRQKLVNQCTDLACHCSREQLERRVETL